MSHSSSRELVEGVVSVVARSAEEKGLELSGRTGARLGDALLGDPARLRQVLVNLVGNAIKFTERGRVVVLADAESESADGISVVVRVEDTGIGVPPEALERLFKPFSQVDVSSTRDHGGTGLGLAICRQLVERMGGEIGVESTPGVGSTFLVPARPAAIRRPRSSAAVAARG